MDKPPHSLTEKKRLLILVVAYNAQNTIDQVLQRIPRTLSKSFSVEVLVLDDASADETFYNADSVRTQGYPFELVTLSNPKNQGYGGNQKLGFYYAIENNFDFVALLHGDGQYAPECLPRLVRPLLDDEYDAVFGTRMSSSSSAIRGGMPIYKFLGNRVLTTYQNILLNTQFTEFHSGYRLYRVRTLSKLQFQRNTQGFNFDTELCYQLLLGGYSIKEEPIPTYYGNEICYVDGLRYAKEVFLATNRAALQSVGLLNDPILSSTDSASGNTKYKNKSYFYSSHSLALESITPNSNVLDIGSGSGELTRQFAQQGCQITTIDRENPTSSHDWNNFFKCDLDKDPLPALPEHFEFVLLLDILEHLSEPEAFVSKLYQRFGAKPDMQFLATTGNVAFLPTRLGLLFGRFNYGPRGILDMTHKRLFTFFSFKRIFTQGGFEVIEARGIPAPFPLVFGDGRFSTCLLTINRMLISLSKSLFSWQIFLRIRPRPSLAAVMANTQAFTKARSGQLDNPN